MLSAQHYEQSPWDGWRRERQANTELLWGARSPRLSLTSQHILHCHTAVDMRKNQTSRPHALVSSGLPAAHLAWHFEMEPQRRKPDAGDRGWDGGEAEGTGSTKGWRWDGAHSPGPECAEETMSWEVNGGRKSEEGEGTDALEYLKKWPRSKHFTVWAAGSLLGL